VGALSATAFFIPILGLVHTAAVVLAMNVIAVLLIVCGSRSSRFLLRKGAEPDTIR
jgi:hypothetical protein